MFDDDFNKKIRDAASDILIKKSREYFDNPSSSAWEIAGVATIAGVIGGILGSMAYEKAQMNKTTSSLGQLSFQIQQMSNEVSNLKNNFHNQASIDVTPNGINSKINGVELPIFDEMGRKIN